VLQGVPTGGCSRNVGKTVDDFLESYMSEKESRSICGRDMGGDWSGGVSL
jgi:hypothetical protein